MQFTTQKISKDKPGICRNILDALPDWFGLQETKEDYAREAADLLMLGCFDDSGSCIGFLSLKDSTSDTIEIYVMGVMPENHHRGIGTALVRHAEERAKKLGKSFLSVKTLSSDHPDPYYAKTRQFYTKIGFKELDVLPMVWGEYNPCLIMVKSI